MNFYNYIYIISTINKEIVLCFTDKEIEFNFI